MQYWNIIFWYNFFQYHYCIYCLSSICLSIHPLIHPSSYLLSIYLRVFQGEPGHYKWHSYYRNQTLNNCEVGVGLCMDIVSFQLFSPMWKGADSLGVGKESWMCTKIWLNWNLLVWPESLGPSWNPHLFLTTFKLYWRSRCSLPLNYTNSWPKS
jgi:hypothetical protein